MRRKRFQKGTVKPRGRGRARYWLAQWRDEEGRKKYKNLGLFSEVTPGQADAMLAQIVQLINLKLARGESVGLRFAEYVKDVFLLTARRRWKESTRSTSEADILRYLIPQFGSKPLPLITRREMQSFLDQIAGRLSTSVVGHLRWHLNSIFRMAKSDGIVQFNPAEALDVPEGKSRGEKRVLSSNQVLQH